MDKRFIEDIVADVRGDYESRLAERRQFESQWQLNGNFVMGNQYCRIGLRGEIEDAEKELATGKRRACVSTYSRPIVEYPPWRTKPRAARR